MKERLALILALVLPIAALGALALYHQQRLATGTRVELPIAGFDPRDLLAGHYLRYRIDYGVAQCPGVPNAPHAGICLRPQKAFFVENPPAPCRLWIEGRCRDGRFEAGIERFYIPEEAARPLEKALMSGLGRVRLSITADGEARVEELLIDGKPWRRWLLDVQPPR